MKTQTIATFAAIALGISAHSSAQERKPSEDRPKEPEAQPARRAVGERPAAREGDRPATREGARPAPREGERRPEAGPQRGFPGAELLTQEEREKFRKAEAQASNDTGVKLAEAALRDAMNALRTAKDTAILAADPSLEPALKKLKEAREKPEPNVRRRVEGEQPRRPEGDQPAAREGAEPRRGEAPREGARKEPAPEK